MFGGVLLIWVELVVNSVLSLCLNVVLLLNMLM